MGTRQAQEVLRFLVTVTVGTGYGCMTVLSPRKVGRAAGPLRAEAPRAPWHPWRRVGASRQRLALLLAGALGACAGDGPTTTAAGDGPALPPGTSGAGETDGCAGIYDAVQCEKAGPPCRFEPGAFFDADPDLGCTPHPRPSGFCTSEAATDLSDACYVDATGSRVACFEVTLVPPPGWRPCGTEDPPWCDLRAPACCCDVLP